MDSCSLGALTVPVTPSPRYGFAAKSFLYGRILKFPSSREYPSSGRKKHLELRTKSSGAKFSSLTTDATSKGIDSKEADLAFVAGATGRVGSRTVRELLKLGFRVRAGVRSKNKAEALVQSVKEMKLKGLQPVEKLELVECDLERPGDQIVPALGNSSVVICCIGASEKEVFDATGPCRIDYQATKNLVDAATSAKVNHFILVSSLGTNKFGFPAAILNLFWGVLIWKRKAEEALIASGIPYTIVRPGGMERPTDTYKETHNITLSEEDTLFGGQVSNLQVAELMAVMAKNRSLSYCKVVEVIAETTAPLTPLEELLAKIPSQRAEPKVPAAAEVLVSSPSSLVTSEPLVVSTPEGESPEIKSMAPRPLSPYTAYENLKPPTSPSPTPLSSKKEANRILEIVLNEEAPPPPEPEEVIAELSGAQKPTPLSPYAVYADLKPPSSPSPSFSGPKAKASTSLSTDETTKHSLGGNDVLNVSVSGVEDAPKDVASYRSPYYVYSDLKPPSSPSPSSSGPKEKATTSLSTDETVEHSVGGNDVTNVSVSGVEDAPEDVASYRSPYYGYENFKPPCSPSPSASLASSPPAASLDLSANGATKTSPLVELPQSAEGHIEKARPLSPYTMYDDLKPPASPTPFP
ncbi:hypothetical protein SAY86_004296 [Trapa natans]|uniref:NAD(P)-binding domain-containing protein n=1 Tax=Trapa natans TaxID=22666 RepID=A0AAN7MFR6_TRANT|nr:hypothetical protein SAY86_004296 [Trapa natans]